MNLHIPFDVGGPGLFIVVLGMGALGLCVGLVIITLAEALVMRFLKWGSLMGSLGASLLMNIVTTIFGLFLGWMFSQWLWFALAISYFLSIAIEGGVLMLIKPKQTRLNWIAAFVANSISYTLLIIIVLAVWNSTPF